MNDQPKADPQCRWCHGSGVVQMSSTFLDRVADDTAPCRCLSQTRRPGIAATDLPNTPDSADKPSRR